ncbi:MAG TPA: hypothetical protein VMU47_11025 [Caldimonas sp.]|nr:hypothetical protein [Caldimonas sp.]
MKATDGLPEDRVTCRECRHYDAGSYRCNRYRVPELGDLPRRCLGFVPLPQDIDQRPGSERWPTLKQDIADIRAIEAAARESGK